MHFVSYVKNHHQWNNLHKNPSLQSSDLVEFDCFAVRLILVVSPWDVVEPGIVVEAGVVVDVEEESTKVDDGELEGDEDTVVDVLWNSPEAFAKTLDKM